MRSERSLNDVYERRFDEDAARSKDAIWAEIARYLGRWIAPDSAVLELGCDRGHFIRNIRARERCGTDVRDMAEYLEPGVAFVQADGLTLRDHLQFAHYDVVFASNYLEHLPSAEAVVEQLREIGRAHV